MIEKDSNLLVNGCNMAEHGTEQARVLSMQTALRLLSLPLLAASLVVLFLIVAATTTVASGIDCGTWTLFMVPLPFGPLAFLATLFGGLSLRD